MKKMLNVIYTLYVYLMHYILKLHQLFVAFNTPVDVFKIMFSETKVIHVTCKRVYYTSIF